MKKCYLSACDRARCVLGLVLIPVLLPAFLLFELLRGLWHCATYLRGHLAWKWKDEIVAAWQVTAGAVSGRNLWQEHDDRQEQECLESQPWTMSTHGERRSMWGGRRSYPDRRQRRELVKLERRVADERRTADRRESDRTHPDMRRRKSDRAHGARRKTDHKRGKK